MKNNSFLVSLFTSGERLWLLLLTFGVLVVFLTILAQNQAISYLKSVQRKHVKILEQSVGVGEIEFYNIEASDDKHGRK